MKTEKDITQLMDIINAAGFEAEDDYSGRNMYGDTCVSFDFDGSESGAILDLQDACDDDEDKELLAQALRGLRTDSMGRGSVMYFPAFSTTETEQANVPA